MAKREASPAYLWYPKDVLSSGRIGELSAAEECWYRRALDRSWLDDGIPADPAKCAAQIGKNCTPKAAEKILQMFFDSKRNDASKMVNDRQEKERKLLNQKRKQKSDAGKRGMAKRWKEKGNGDNTVITENNIPIPIPISITRVRKEEEIRDTPQAASTPKRGSRIPDSFLLTSEMRSWAATKKPDVDLALETEKFCNYWRSATGRNATKMDWVLTWKNWILNARTNGSNKNSTYGRKRTDQDVFAESAEFYANYDEQPIA